MIPAVVYAIPAFVLLVVVEALSYRFLPDDDERGYELRDTVTSMSMGAGSQVVAVPWKAATILVYAAVFTVAPWHLSPSSAWTWVLLFFGDDLAYYAFHRAHHRVRVLWASHVVHHSSLCFNLSTALRQSWTPMTGLPFWLPLALLGVPAWMILLQQAFSLVYQFFLHTERVDRLWRPVEWFFNTPSHHRVHHGSNNVYLDRNYGGILIVWDRLFGTFEPEGVRVVYGLTKNIDTYNPVRVAFHEFQAAWRDVRTARRWRDRAGYLFGPPGWAPRAEGDMPPLIFAFAALAALDIAGVAAGLPPLEWVAKPLLAPVLAVHLWRRTGTRHAPVLAGLGLAAAGDVALMLPGTGAFAAGIAFFLGAQLCWTAAFLRAGALRHVRRRRLLCAVHLAGWAAAVAALAPSLGPVLGTAVAVYAAALVAMALTARVLGPRAAWGGMVFLGSDLLVGLGAAGTGFPGRGVLVMMTYTIALALITSAFTGGEVQELRDGRDARTLEGRSPSL